MNSTAKWFSSMEENRKIYKKKQEKLASGRLAA
jgi:hypothetical protein